MAGNIGVAHAYVADLVGADRRAGAMGRVGAAAGLGFVVGPAIGGLLAGPDPLQADFVLPFIVAAAAAAAAFVLATILLRESASGGQLARARSNPGSRSGAASARPDCPAPVAGLLHPFRVRRDRDGLRALVGGAVSAGADPERLHVYLHGRGGGPGAGRGRRADHPLRRRALHGGGGHERDDGRLPAPAIRLGDGCRHAGARPDRLWRIGLRPFLVLPHLAAGAPARARRPPRHLAILRRARADPRSRAQRLDLRGLGHHWPFLLGAATMLAAVSLRWLLRSRHRAS